MTADKEKKDHDKQSETPKTETSRLKINRPDQKKPDTDKASEVQSAGGAGKPPEKTGEETTLTDPMSLRDTNTSKVKRVKGTKEGPGATAVVPGSSESGDQEHATDTVQLKVVQQKKKEISDMMSPASTVRLRSPGDKRAKSGDRQSPGLGTDKEKLEQGEDAAQSASAPNKKDDTSTKQLKKVTDKTKAEEQRGTPEKTVRLPSQKGGVKPQPPSKAGRTLKIKTGTGGSPRRTTKTGGAQSEASKSAADSGQTVKVSGGASQTVPAGGLRLKKQAESKPAEQQESAISQPAPMPIPQSQPGWGVTIAALVAFAGAGVLLYFLIEQTVKHIW